MSSLEFDSKTLLTVICAGDGRFANKLRRDELLPLGSRIRARLTLEYAGRDDLMACLQHLLTRAGNPTLRRKELMKILLIG